MAASDGAVANEPFPDDAQFFYPCLRQYLINYRDVVCTLMPITSNILIISKRCVE